jgi:hypothetical protein
MDRDESQGGAPKDQPLSQQAAEGRHADGAAEHPAVHYEQKDVRFGCLLSLIIVAACIVAALGYGVWHFFWREAALQQTAKTSPYPLAPNLSAKLPPEPRLEQLNRLTPEELAAFSRTTLQEIAEVNEQLGAQEKALHRYGPTGEKGFVHIPIEQAMKAVAGNLPVAKNASPGRDANGLLDAGQSNSGRMFRGALP